MNDDFNFDTHCVVCKEPRGSHPTESNNPRPLFQEGRACRDCDAYITAARMKTWGITDDDARAFVVQTLHDFLNFVASIKKAKRFADEMMQTEMTRLEAEETARNEDHGVLLDDGNECWKCGTIVSMEDTIVEGTKSFCEGCADDTEEDWS